MKYEEKIIKKDEIYQGNVIRVDLWKVLLPDGKEAPRDVVVHPGASVVVPIAENGDVYMVRQYRTPIRKESLEIPAGKLDKGEDPLDCAHRELKEETGLTCSSMKHIISIHSTPGFCNEVLHMYIATGLQEGEACADEDEFISAERIHVSKLVDMVLNHEITDAKSIIGILLADKIINREIK